MKSVICWAFILLMGVAAGCGSLGAASGEDALSPATARLTPTAPDSIDTPATALTEGDDDEFDFLDEQLVEEMAVSDPLEGWNRAMFRFNDVIYVEIATPVLEGYAKLVPESVRIALRNFFHNLGMPIRLVNCLLQGKWAAAEVELFRFAVNTTVGVLGFRDAAAEIHGVRPMEEDLGQTLAVWGMDNGWYLVWPLLGPSTLRDSVGMLGDQFLNPVRYLEPWPVPLGLSVLSVINDGSFHLGTYEDLTSDALDPYVAIRQAYIQYRNKQIQE